MDEVVWLLGAGASRDADLPLASELTSQVMRAFASAVRRKYGSPEEQASRTLNFVVSQIVGHRGKRGSDPSSLPDIETVASTIELLAERDSVELAPFVQSWEPAVASFDRDPTYSEALFLAESIRDDLLDPEDTTHSALARHLGAFVRYEVRGGTGSGYQALLAEMLRQVVRLLQIRDPARLEYLAPLVNLGNVPGGVTIATLNYDLCVETAASQLGVPCSRGLDRWDTEGLVQFPDEGVRLLKLHGSIDWKRSEWRPDPHNHVYGVRREILDVDGSELQPDEVPYLVFGRREKLRPEGPSLELISDLRARLSRARVLMILGYSFADGHINELIARWSSQGVGRVVVVVDPKFSQRLNRIHFSQFRRRLVSGMQGAWSRERGQPTGGQIVIVRRSAAVALPDLCAADYSTLKARAASAPREMGNPFEKKS